MQENIGKMHDSRSFWRIDAQTFRFMVGPGHCPMISKYGPSLPKAVGPVDPSFLIVKKSHYNKKIHHTAILITNGSLMKVEATWSILQYFWPPLSDNWYSFLSGRLRQDLLYNQQAIYINAYKCLCQCVGSKVYFRLVWSCLGPSF